MAQSDLSRAEAQEFWRVAMDARRRLRVDPRDPCAAARFGIAMAALGNQQAAVTSLRRAACLEPWNAEHHHALGVVLVNLGRLDEGARHITRAIAIKPDEPRFAVSYAVVAARTMRGKVVRLPKRGDAAEGSV